MNIFLISSLLFLSACATMKPSDCNYEYGYAQGVNSAKSDLPLYTNLDREGVCSEEGKKELLKGNREGYNFVLASKPSTTNITLNNETNSYGSSPRVKKECLEAYGKKVCGYHCKSAYGVVKCAPKSDMDCVAAYGNIECGYNCIAQYGQITCDK